VSRATYRACACAAATIALAAFGTPVRAQIATAADCARMPSQAEEITCLRHALEQSQDALRGDAGGIRPAPQRTAAEPQHPVAAAEELGVEQVTGSPAHPKAEAPRRSVGAVVTAASEDARGLTTFHLDNGQVWRQVEQSGIPLSLEQSRTYPVEITGSGFGGYRMHFSDSGRVVVVRRLQ
jgi:hypothetical protein